MRSVASDAAKWPLTRRIVAHLRGKDRAANLEMLAYLDHTGRQMFGLKCPGRARSERLHNNPKVAGGENRMVGLDLCRCKSSR